MINYKYFNQDKKSAFNKYIHLVKNIKDIKNLKFIHNNLNDILIFYMRGSQEDTRECLSGFYDFLNYYVLKKHE